MTNRHNTLTDDVFKDSKYIDKLQRQYGIKNFRKEYPNQYKIILDIFQTIILVSNCFESDSNLSLADKTDKARTIIETLIYNDYENSQKHKYSVKDIKDLLDKRARKLYNLMAEWQKVFATITTKNAITSIELKEIIETIKKEMQELEYAEFDSISIDNISYQKNTIKNYKIYAKYFSKFDNIYSKCDEFKEQYFIPLYKKTSDMIKRYGDVYERIS